MIHRFEFDTVADHFDSHIAYSIPGYDDLIETALKLAPAFIQPAGRVYDLGCSTGALLKTIEQMHDTVELVGYDIEPAFQRQWHRHYLQLADIRSAPINMAGLVFSLFTLQFLPPADVPGVIRRIYDGLLPGGALILAEKTYYQTGHMQELASVIYQDGKRQLFGDTELLDKTASLLPAMRLNTGSQTANLLKSAGFTTVEPIWQRLHFRAWLAVKDIK